MSDEDEPRSKYPRLVSSFVALAGLFWPAASRPDPPAFQEDVPVPDAVATEVAADTTARDKVFGMADMLWEVASHLTPQEVARLLMSHKLALGQADRILGRADYWRGQFERRFATTQLPALWRWYEESIRSGLLQRLADKYSKELGATLAQLQALSPTKRAMSLYFAAEATMLSTAIAALQNQLIGWSPTRSWGSSDEFHDADVYKEQKRFNPVRSITFSGPTIDKTLAGLNEVTSGAYRNTSLQSAIAHFAKDAVIGRCGPERTADAEALSSAWRERPPYSVLLEDVYGPFSQTIAEEKAHELQRRHAKTSEELQRVDAAAGADCEWEVPYGWGTQQISNLRFLIAPDGSITTHFSWKKSVGWLGVYFTAKRTIWFNYVEWQTIQPAGVDKETPLPFGATKFKKVAGIVGAMSYITRNPVYGLASLPIFDWEMPAFQARLSAAGVALPITEDNVAQAIMALENRGMLQRGFAKDMSSSITALDCLPALIVLIAGLHAENKSTLPRLFRARFLTACAQCDSTKPTHVDPVERRAYCAACVLRL